MITTCAAAGGGMELIMKKKVMLAYTLILIIFAVCSCNNNDNNVTGNIPTQSASYEFAYDDQEYYPKHRMAESEEGYYFQSGDLLYYMDKSSGKMVPLCTKVDCDHITTECDASMWEYGLEVYCYDNKLYLLKLDIETAEYWLYEADLDGTNRNRLCYLFTSGGQGISYNLSIHRGYAYFSVMNPDYTTNDERAMYRVALSKDAKSEKIDTINAYGSSFIGLKGYGNYVYFQKGQYEDNQANGFKCPLYRYDIITGKVEEIYEKTNYDYRVVDQNIYFLNDEGIRVLNLNTSKVNNLYDIEGEECNSNMYYKNQYLFVDNRFKFDFDDWEDRRIDVIDINGNLVDSILISNGNTYWGNSDNYLFLFDEYEIPEGTDAIVSIYDKSQLQTEQNEWKHLGWK